jgi:hypothetical protein
MAQNIDPIFSHIPDCSTNAGAGMPSIVTGQDASPTGTGVLSSLIFSADPTNGSYLQRVRLKPAGTNIASVARFFLNNGYSQATSANNCIYGEVSLPATTGINSASLIEIDYPFNYALPSGWRVYMSLGSGVVAGWTALGIGGRY